MTIEILNPTYAEAPPDFEPATRPDGLAGLTIGIISNGKHGTVPFFDALEAELRDRHGAANVIRVVKPNYSAPVGTEILHQASTWHALVAGIGD